MSRRSSLGCLALLLAVAATLSLASPSGADPCTFEEMGDAGWFKFRVGSGTCFAQPYFSPYWTVAATMARLSGAASTSTSS